MGRELLALGLFALLWGWGAMAEEISAFNAEDTSYFAEDDVKGSGMLACCSDGYLTMPTYYRMGSKGFGSDVKGVFDCTCFKPSTQAQFPRA